MLLTPHYDLWFIAASVVIASLTFYVALDLARRARTSSGELNLPWWAAGSFVLGTGIWAMQFVGLLGFSLPIPLGLAAAMTALSWASAMAAAGIALWIASRPGDALIAPGALVVGAGLGGMHYIGMAALDMKPGIAWHMPTVALSLLIAVGASAVILTLFHRLMQMRELPRPSIHLLAALTMAATVCAMHFTGMDAAKFPADSVCLSIDGIHGKGLAAVVAVGTGVLLLGILYASILESRLQVVAMRLTRSLQESNAQLQSANQELQQHALGDPLTGLANRVLFEDRLGHALTRINRANNVQIVERIAVLFVDLDGFKPINDSFGHAAGDLVLRATADRLSREARASDTVARVGADEFLVLLEGVLDTADCVQMAKRILRALAQPFELAGKQLQIACSIGIVIHPDQGEPGKLVANADAAMRQAKRGGGGNYAVFESSMGVDVAGQLQLLSDLRVAIERNQFELYYQPKIDARRNQISGVEALVRWNHPQRGLVGPAEFINLTERFGLIVRLGDWIIDEACRQVAAWSKQGLHMRVAINLSALQLREGGLADKVEEALRRHDVLRSQLLCEITESVAMEDITATKRTFEGLSLIGVYLSIDDFGTGYSSLSHLRQLPARQLKIDGSFVQELETKEDARAVVEAVIRLAHALSLTVVAEGVETQGQHDILMRLGCDEFQGYFFARPMPADELARWALAARESRQPVLAPAR
ncbi:putative bifunctional diguanylate cyclase/phosphodiesterase [Variovorax sp. PBL-E5]|uniref:putative bifunctional diguanylate cyclase/phosphodiesterase n=1 Tax=Variovorax sp. PBL-E5 TaxID=434014 RepID=UPI0013192010|nr:EAL domain-containing protein [Variovorax sp. PBL-E5]VTU25785.1 Cyclic di-GMP phosphodiesterase Gmr [Variovorax sp. PBL-E5]